MPGINAFTKLMLHSNGADTSTTFTDDSGTSKTVTAYRDAQLDTAQKKFGTASGLYAGDGTTSSDVDYLLTESHADFGFGANDFCVDFQIKFSTVAGGLRTGLRAVTGGYGMIWRFDDNSTMRLYLSTDTGFTDIANNVAGTKTNWNTSDWYHIALTWDGTTYRVFVDGVEEISVTSSTATYGSAQQMYIGCWTSGDYGLAGWIDEFRVQKGEAVWTDDFTPPTEEYNDTPEATGGINSYKTLLGVGL